MIKLLKDLTAKYVPQADGEIVEEVFFGGNLFTHIMQMQIDNAI